MTIFSLNTYRLVFAITLGFLSLKAANAQECSLVKTNRSCTYTVDRSLPLTPPTIQMYSGATVTVAIKNSYTFETYSLDWASGLATTPPDVGAAAFTALQPSLKNVGQWQAMAYIVRLTAPSVQQCDAKIVKKISEDKKVPEAKKDDTYLGVISACSDKFNSLQDDAAKVYSQLQVAIWPTSNPATMSPAATAIGLPAIPGEKHNDLPWEIALTCEIVDKEMFFDTSGNPLVLDPSKNPINCTTQGSPVSPGLANREADVSMEIGAIASTLNPSSGALSTNPNVLASLQILQDMKTTLDSTRTDLLAYSFRIAGLVKQPLPTPNKIASIQAVKSSETVIPQVIYNVNALNLVGVSQSTTDATKKQLVLAITVVYGDVRLEVSAGTFFSSLPIRSFSASAVFTNDAVTDRKVTQQILRPLVIPFAALNFRITDDWKYVPWRANLYWTGAIGINPNTVTTDFATGPSLSYRLLMFSALWHIGHDTRLTQGFNVGDSLGASFSGSVPTETYWRFDSFAFGVSIRTPSLTNR